MKEAAGEANMTVITIVLIAIVLAVGTVIVNNMLNSSKKSSCCASNGGVWHNSKCYAQCTVSDNGTKTCSGSVKDTCNTSTEQQ